MKADSITQNMSSETADETLPTGAHQGAAAAFVDEARSLHGEDLLELYVFGSTVRNEASGRSSDVDVFIVLQKTPRYEEVADSLRDLAYDVMLEHGPLVELHILDEDEFERHRREGNPFVQNVLNEGQSYA
jgi:predicted nucleotidyltransferase